MTVAEYIEALRLLPQDLPCLLYEGEWGFYVTSAGPKLREIGVRNNRHAEIMEDSYVGDERQVSRFTAVIL